MGRTFLYPSDAVLLSSDCRYVVLPLHAGHFILCHPRPYLLSSSSSILAADDWNDMAASATWLRHGKGGAMPGWPAALSGGRDGWVWMNGNSGFRRSSGHSRCALRCSQVPGTPENNATHLRRQEVVVALAGDVWDGGRAAWLRASMSAFALRSLACRAAVVAHAAPLQPYLRRGLA